MASAFSITIRQDPGLTRATLVGTVDELADLTPLATLRGKVEPNMRGLRPFNSIGVRYWMDALRDVATRCQLTYVECSRPVIEQLNMIRGFLANGTVRSFCAPLRCEACDHDEDHVFAMAAVVDHDGLPPVACPSCKSPMELDDFEDSYLLFMREPTMVRDG